MKCNNCGNEITENSAFCSFCGNPSSPIEQTETPVSAVRQKLLNIFKDNLFLALCILVSASTVFSIASANLPLLRILFTIFLWLIYARATDNKVDINNMRNVSGTIFAGYVITWVLIGLLGFVFITCASIAMALGSIEELREIIAELLSAFNFSFSDSGAIASLIANPIMMVVTVAFVMVFVICAIAAIINIVGKRSIHKFAQSLYKSAEADNFSLEKLNVANTWILVLGILNCVAALGCISDFLPLVSNGCIGAAYIIAHVLIKKNFRESQQEIN